jgi:hypothetical protein
MKCATSSAGTAHSSGTPVFIPGTLWGFCCSIISVYLVVVCLFVPFSSYHCIMSPPTFVGRHIVFVLSVGPSVRHTVCQRNSSETTEQNFMKLGRQ